MKRRLGLKRPRGSRIGLTVPQAEAELRRLMRLEVPTAVETRLTLSEAGESYRKHLQTTGKPKTGQKRKRSTLKAVESTFHIWLDPQLGELSLDKITRETVADLICTMENAGVGPKSIRNYIGTLSALYRYAVRQKWVTSSPVDGIDLPALERTEEIRYLTVQDVRILAASAVPGEHQALDRALYITASMTRLRQGELLALRWRDVDWQAQRIHVRRSHVLGDFDTPKGHKARAVPMGVEVVRELDSWQQATPWGTQDALVFAEPSTGKVLRRGALMRRYRRALKAAQLDETHRFHDLRHTFGTAMAKAGMPMRTLQEIMGHADYKTTMIYAGYAPNAQEVAMVDQAFADELDARGSIRGPILSEPNSTQENSSPANTG